MPFGPVVTVENEAEMRRIFKYVEGRGSDLAKANRLVAKVAETGSRDRAESGTRQQASAAKALAAKATQSAAQLAIRNTAGVKYGVGSFMGARRWHQFPDWVGNTWNLAEGTGPYVIAEWFAAGGVEKIKDEYMKQIAANLRSAGLEVT